MANLFQQYISGWQVGFPTYLIVTFSLLQPHLHKVMTMHNYRRTNKWTISNHSLSIQSLSLTLFVLWIFADNANASFSFDYFAFFANWFYWWSNLHVKSSFHPLLCLLSLHDFSHSSFALCATLRPKGRLMPRNVLI